MKLSALAIATTLFSTSVLAAPLTLQTYNPQENGIFAVNSTLASGPHEAVLFDAQFSVKDGEKLVEMIKKSGKKLTRIVITSGDPDFYFGLEPLVKAFPDVNVVATAEVVKHINATKAAKLAYWGPQMKDGAPKQVYVPQAQQVIPGHYLGTPPAGDRAITFTRDYLTQFEQALNAHKDSAGVIKAMKQRWPGLAEVSSLDLSAKVNTGEMKW